MRLEVISFNKADELNDELNEHHRDTVLFDGRTAVESLRLVAKAPRTFGPPVVIRNGQEHARQRASDALQRTLAL